VRSLRQRFVLAAVGVLLALTLAVLAGVHLLSRDALLDEKARAGARHAALLSAALSPMLAERDWPAVEGLARDLVVGGSFTHLRVFDADDREIAAAGEPPAPGVAINPFVFGGDLVLAGQRFGRFEAAVSAAPSAAAERRMLLGLMVLGAVALTVAALVQWVLAQRLTRRLDALVEGTRRVAGGDLALRLGGGPADEVGRLADAFDRMSEALSRRIEALETSESTQRRLVEALAEGVVFQDRDDRVLECNEAAPRILGMTREQLLGKSSMDPRWRAVHADGSPFDFTQHPSVLALRSGQPVHDVLMGVDRPSGGRAWISINSQPLFAAGATEPHATVTSFNDVTARIEAERSLQRANEDLERRVAERTAELASARDSAEAASRAKTEFLSRMSHELRTPLNAILGFAQVLRLRLAPAPPGVDQQLGYIEEGGWHLLALIDDVLDLSRIEAGAMTVSRDRVQVAPLLDDCARLVGAVAARHAVDLAVEPTAAELYVEADRTRLRQVLVNLLSNACKYNRPSGRVLLAVDAGPRDVRLIVEDTGIGLTPSQLESLYEPFNRLGAERSGIEGTGIGLVITRRLVDLMGGRLEVQSRPGEGTRFAVVLPRAAAPAAPIGAVAGAGPGAAAAPGPGRTLLYVEDNAANVRLLQGVLAMRPGWTLCVAGDGIEALERVAGSAPDAVVVDISLPGMDGFELCRRLRAEPALRKRPIVALSANAMERDRRRGFDAGFDDYFTKPLDLARFLSWLDGLGQNPA
jgi:PAS domain S-box-containing protein